MAVHEFGHVAGAILTNGKVTCVVLHPLSISRTDVSPNPCPAIVVWSGPVLGCLLPVLAMWLVGKSRNAIGTKIVRFYCGFCWIANGAYIGIGSFDRVGDCQQMLQTGSPHWVLVMFGVITIPAGFVIWHRLGSVQAFWKHPTSVTRKVALSALVAAGMTVFASAMLSGR